MYTNALRWTFGDQLLDLVSLLLPRDLGHLRNRCADGVAEGADGEIFAGEHILHLEAIGLAKRTFEQIGCDLEADEVVIRLRQEGAVGDMDDVEGELHHDVTLRILDVGDLVAVTGAQLRILDGTARLTPSGWPVESAT